MTIQTITVRTHAEPLSMPADLIAGTHFALTPRLVRYATGDRIDPHFGGGFRLVHRPSGRTLPAPGWPWEADAAEEVDLLRSVALALEAARGVDWALASPVSTPRAAEAARVILGDVLGVYSCDGDGWLA